jgi:hypothetical protein
VPAIAELTRDCDLSAVTVAQCAFGAHFRKWTTLFFSPRLRPLVSGWRHRLCPHGFATHSAVAHGRSPEGLPRAAMSGAYPTGLNAALADVALASSRVSPSRLPPALSPPGVGGKVTDGASLSKALASNMSHPPGACARRGRRSGPPAAGSRSPARAAAAPSCSCSPCSSRQPPKTAIRCGIRLTTTRRRSTRPWQTRANRRCAGRGAGRGWRWRLAHVARRGSGRWRHSRLPPWTAAGRPCLSNRPLRLVIGSFSPNRLETIRGQPATN